MDEWQAEWMNGNKMNRCWVVLCVDYDPMSERKLSAPEIECSWNVIDNSPRRRGKWEWVQLWKVQQDKDHNNQTQGWKIKAAGGLNHLLYILKAGPFARRSVFVLMWDTGTSQSTSAFRR